MNTKKLIGVILLAAVVLSITGCAPPCPEVSGIDNRLRHYDKPATAYTPVPSYPSYQPSTSSVKGKTILIDAGHGGKDPGTLGIKLGSSLGTPEKNINLDVAKKVAAKLSSMGANVRLTRSNDTFIELDDRAALVGRYRADIFVSIHADYIGDSSISGPSCYIARQSTTQSRKIADSIIRQFEKNGIKTRGVRKANYRVLVKHPKPATLVEVGYLSNYREARALNSSSYRSKVASIIADGIANSF
ncbi:MAG: N-acetylmuramoyl-L-alanine amidase [Sedimentisphaeraceae bacterium JB056]